MKNYLKILFLIILLLTCLGGILFYKNREKYYIFVKFSETGPLHKNIPVYYKGCLIGKITEINLAKDYKYTVVKVVFKQTPKLPKSIKANVKNNDIVEKYIDLTTDDEADTSILANGETINGIALSDFQSFFSELANADLLIPLLEAFIETLGSINETSTELKELVSDSRSLVKENQSNIKQTTKNLAEGSKSLKRISNRADISISDNQLKSTVQNFDKTSKNIESASARLKNIAENVDFATKDIDKTVEKIDSTLCEINKTAKNATEITGGFSETLKKQFAGIRIIFGKPIKRKYHQNRCCE